MPTPASLSSTSKISRQRNPVKHVRLRSGVDAVQTLTRLPKGLKELYLDEICLNDELTWFLIESRFERFLLRNCTFDPNSSTGFWKVLEFLAHGSSSKSCFRFNVQFNDWITQWTLYDESSSLASNDLPSITSLIFILSGNTIQQSFLGDISSLAFLLPKLDLKKPLSSMSKTNLWSTMTHQKSKLKRLLLKDLDLDNNIETYVPILQRQLDFIYLWNCGFKTADLIWSTLCVSMKLLSSVHTSRVHTCQFAIQRRGHTTQIVNNTSSSFSEPNSPDLVYALISLLGQDSSDGLSWDKFSLLVFIPPGAEFSEPLSLQSKQSLRSIMNRHCPKLKYLLLCGIDFDGNIEELISISQRKLDLIYLWNFGIETHDPIWGALIISIELANLSFVRPIDSLKFSIRTNGHTTQIVTCRGSSFPMPNLPDMPHGLIITLPDDLPNDLLSRDAFIMAPLFWKRISPISYCLLNPNNVWSSLGIVDVQALNVFC